MHITDPIADMLTRIRNANSARHDTVDVPASNMKKSIAQILLDEGYITNVAVDPSRRRQGVAAQLLQVFDNFAKGNRLAFLTLEVRPSNAAAIATTFVKRIASLTETGIFTSAQTRWAIVT